jgi:hypothetical protein
MTDSTGHQPAPPLATQQKGRTTMTTDQQEFRDHAREQADAARAAESRAHRDATAQEQAMLAAEVDTPERLAAQSARRDHAAQAEKYAASAAGWDARADDVGAMAPEAWANFKAEEQARSAR